MIYVWQSVGVILILTVIAWLLLITMCFDEFVDSVNRANHFHARKIESLSDSLSDLENDVRVKNDSMIKQLNRYENNLREVHLIIKELDKLK